MRTLPHFTWIIDPTMNLISKTYHLYEKREYAFMVLWKYIIISQGPRWVYQFKDQIQLTQTSKVFRDSKKQKNEGSKFLNSNILEIPMFKKTNVLS